MTQLTKSQQIIGTWKLSVLEDLVDNKWTRTFGENPEGYFSFDAAGHVSVQFQKEHGIKLFAGERPTPDEAKNAYDRYLAYFGTYTVDEHAGTFTSIVAGALNPALIGTKQTRKFEIKDHQLAVGDFVTYRRYFERT